MLEDATVDFGRLEIFMDHVWERDRQSGKLIVYRRNNEEARSPKAYDLLR